jgi:hypothetical protein
MWRICIALLVVLVGCSALLPVLTEEDAQRAETRWPTATFPTLKSGRQKYIDRCGGCHSLHLPSEFTEDQWRKAVGDMQQRAHVSPEEKDLILQYLAVARSK